MRYCVQERYDRQPARPRRYPDDDLWRRRDAQIDWGAVMGLQHDPDDYRTPQYVLDWIEHYICEITHDGACNELMLSRSGIWSPLPNSVATPIDIMQLLLPSMLRVAEPSHVFINPPWDTPTILELVHAASILNEVDETMTFTFLLPNKLCNKAWVEQVFPHLHTIIFLGGRINFEGPNAAPAAKTRHGCFLGIIDRCSQVPQVSAITIKQMKRDVRNLASRQND